jgi:hypothetical protein
MSWLQHQPLSFNRPAVEAAGAGAAGLRTAGGHSMRPSALLLVEAFGDFAHLDKALLHQHAPINDDVAQVVPETEEARGIVTAPQTTKEHCSCGVRVSMLRPRLRWSSILVKAGDGQNPPRSGSGHRRCMQPSSGDRSRRPRL